MIKFKLDKVIQKINELNFDKDELHVILYFFSYKSRRIFYNMEERIINLLTNNFKNIRIIFISTHSLIDPYRILKQKSRDIIRSKINRIINEIYNNFRGSYSLNNNYFQKDSLIQRNLIFINLEKDYDRDEDPFGMDKVMQSICINILQGNDINQIIKIKDKLAKAIIEKNKNNENFDKDIEKCLSKVYFLKHLTFSVLKKMVIDEAQNLYDNIFNFNKNNIYLSSFLSDIKLNNNKYQKFEFEKKLNRIFGFNLNIRIHENESYSIISFNDDQSYCSKCLKQYINSYEEFKYYSLYHYINCLFLGLEYLEKNIMNFAFKTDFSIKNIVQNIKNNIEHELKAASGKGNSIEIEDEIRRRITLLN